MKLRPVVKGTPSQERQLEKAPAQVYRIKVGAPLWGDARCKAPANVFEVLVALLGSNGVVGSLFCENAPSKGEELSTLRISDLM